jgi:uncharacterized protein (TIGR04255 family)
VLDKSYNHTTFETVSSYPQLSKAPITMAILEIRFTSPASITNEGLRDAKDVLKENYPTHNYTTNAQIELKPDQLKTIVQLKSSQISGNIFQSPDRKREILLSTVVYNFKQHGSYTTWADFRDAALDGWHKCKRLLNTELITWISLRYINNIEIPVEQNKSIPAESLFKTFIANEGQNKEQSISAYSLRYTHHTDEKNLMVHFGQELLPALPEATGALPFIIDIDVIYNKSHQPSDIDIDQKFEELRDIKNDYFFDNLTDNTYKLLI